MNEKIRVNIYVDKYAWEELPKYIACSKSNWINEQILKKISQHDDVADLERKINEISALVEGLQFDKENLEARKKELLDERKRNEQSFEIINNAMNTIRIVNENQGYINNLLSTVLQCRRSYRIRRIQCNISINLIYHIPCKYVH